ncbi:MAG: hypothetical protein IKZ47_06865 [Clostridia bacterium]|nr:hypothetical protein [Clostridia bacterium]
MKSFHWLINPATAYFIEKPLIVLSLVFALLLAVSVILVFVALKREENGDDR